MELKDYKRYQKLEDYVDEKLNDEFKTDSWKEAQNLCVERICQNYIRFDPEIFGLYPDLLKPCLKNAKYQLTYKNGKIVGRD